MNGEIKKVNHGKFLFRREVERLLIGIGGGLLAIALIALTRVAELPANLTSTPAVTPIHSSISSQAAKEQLQLLNPKFTIHRD